MCNLSITHYQLQRAVQSATISVACDVAGDPECRLLIYEAHHFTNELHDFCLILVNNEA